MKQSKLKVFGHHLRNLRRQKGLSQEQVADLSGLHRTYFGGVERGERNPTLLTLIKIAQSLDIQLEELLKFNDKKE